MSANNFFQAIPRTVSRTRFEQYRKSGASDLDALACYLWNVALAEALYPPLQILEVAFRNAVHQEIGTLTPSRE